MRALIPAKNGTAWFALDALSIQEILAGRPWVPVPHASSLVPGVLAWRGRAIAVLDLSPLLVSGEALRPDAPPARMLIVEAGSCTLAIPVDLVREVHEIEPLELRAPHATRIRHTSAEIELLGCPMPVLDLSSLVESITS